MLKSFIKWLYQSTPLLAVWVSIFIFNWTSPCRPFKDTSYSTCPKLCCPAQWMTVSPDIQSMRPGKHPRPFPFPFCLLPISRYRILLCTIRACSHSFLLEVFIISHLDSSFLPGRHAPSLIPSNPSIPVLSKPPFLKSKPNPSVFAYRIRELAPAYLPGPPLTILSSSNETPRFYLHRTAYCFSSSTFTQIYPFSI